MMLHGCRLTFVRYHHLNHHSMFGGGYRSGAEAIMSRLLKTYDGNK